MPLVSLRLFPLPFCACKSDTKDVILTGDLLSLIGNLRGNPGPKGIVVDGTLPLLIPAAGGRGPGWIGKFCLFFPNGRVRGLNDIIRSVGKLRIGFRVRRS